MRMNILACQGNILHYADAKGGKNHHCFDELAKILNQYVAMLSHIDSKTCGLNENTANEFTTKLENVPYLSSITIKAITRNIRKYIKFAQDVKLNEYFVDFLNCLKHHDILSQYDEKFTTLSSITRDKLTTEIFVIKCRIENVHASTGRISNLFLRAIDKFSSFTTDLSYDVAEMCDINYEIHADLGVRMTLMDLNLKSAKYLDAIKSDQGSLWKLYLLYKDAVRIAFNEIRIGWSCLPDKIGDILNGRPSLITHKPRTLFDFNEFENVEHFLENERKAITEFDETLKTKQKWIGDYSEILVFNKYIVEWANVETSRVPSEAIKIIEELINNFKKLRNNDKKNFDDFLTEFHRFVAHFDAFKLTTKPMLMKDNFNIQKDIITPYKNVIRELTSNQPDIQPILTNVKMNSEKIKAKADELKNDFEELIPITDNIRALLIEMNCAYKYPSSDALLNLFYLKNVIGDLNTEFGKVNKMFGEPKWKTAVPNKIKELDSLLANVHADQLNIPAALDAFFKAPHS